ncbi:DUF445 domain-containing protein [Rhodopila globiformis]|uniref:DUF445 domain-containing protein n=1 Tax=Rhodopila globiformis TaxID=1071 RepID=A0A2S6N3Z9_RHOGL|nr:DUF445 domain-containing protein [Rhodopila globiformis]PPQ29332.1 DUF445 domain-containing protein [Rhodopila globiformis]
MTELNPDTLARESLQRHRLVATGLLVLMAVLTLFSYRMPHTWTTELLQSAAKAGFVGGIADWFAITALFRHPLGIPIPHTAIIPNQRERLGRALGRFVANHVFTSQEVANVLGRLDLPGIVHRFLADPEAARPAAIGLAGMLPKLLSSVEDGRARRIVRRMVPHVLGGPAAGHVIARALHNLVDSGRHQEVFGFILAQMKATLAGRESALRYAIEERVREQGGRLVGWALGASIARRVLSLVNAELDKMSPDGSELREAFDEWIRREIQRMETDPARAAEIGSAIRRVVAHETIQVWLWDLWGRLRLALEEDLGRPSSRTVAYIEAALANLGTILENDPVARARLQTAVEKVVATVLPDAQARLAEFIAQVVANWDTETIVDRLELRIGRDLQYIRMNGTIVGFLIGGLLFALLDSLFGYTSF